MADTNRQAVATVSLEQVMSSVPPQLGPGGHPRYSQHLERERPGGPAMGYGGPPAPPGSYGNSYSSYPPPPYGNSMHGNYGAGPIPGVPPPGYPRAGYPVQSPHSSAYGSGYGPGPGPGPSAGGFPQSVHHPSYYGGGYESHYGGQPPPGHPSHQQALQASYRGQSPIPQTSTGAPGSNVRGPNNGLPTAPPSSDQLSALMSKKAGTKANHGATAEGDGKSSSPQQSPERTQQHNLSDHGEVERLRAVAATEITTEEVKPIQTDFHFFVKEHIGTHRKLAEEEVRSGMEDQSKKLDSLIVNSNLNTRLMKTWEGLSKESREAYMVREEADRRRFMEDDEIASRHCATLTARGKSPRVVGSDNNEELVQQQQKVKKEPQQEEESNAPKTVVNAPIKDEAKRSASEAGGASDIHGSPTKKTKAV